MSAMKRILSHTLHSVADKRGDTLYDDAAVRERRIAEALETQEVFAAAIRPPMARRFPQRNRPMAVRRNRVIRAIHAATAAFCRELRA